MQLSAVSIEVHEIIPTFPAAQPHFLVDAPAQCVVSGFGMDSSVPPSQWLGESGGGYFRGRQRCNRKLADLALVAR